MKIYLHLTNPPFPFIVFFFPVENVEGKFRKIRVQLSNLEKIRADPPKNIKKWKKKQLIYVISELKKTKKTFRFSDFAHSIAFQGERPKKVTFLQATPSKNIKK